MTNDQHGPRLRSWPELRRRVLDQDYLTIGQLHDRRRRARQTKHGIWMLTLLLPLVPLVIARGASSAIALAMLLICGGAVGFYLLGARWERRWAELIREKTADVHSEELHRPL